MKPINTHEYLLSVDEFGNPKVVKDSKAIGQMLKHLLLLEPGTFQSHPDMGVGLVSKYRYSNDVRGLRDDFRAQITKYLPQYQAVQVECKMLQDNVCYIGATIDGNIYGFFYDTDKNSITPTFKMLQDL